MQASAAIASCTTNWWRRLKRSELGIDWYEALLYWKLYALPTSDSNITKSIQCLACRDLRRLVEETPATLPRQHEDVVKRIKWLGSYQLLGMKSSTALPVRTTFLHILHPKVVPIFDQMVLKAIGAWRKGANQEITVLREYVPHAWALADKHTQQLADLQESPLRLVDMALWVMRNPA